MTEDYSTKLKEDIISELQSLKEKQTKENKKLLKLEEAFIKTTSELKNIKNDKYQLESFLKYIFPLEIHETAIHLENEHGLYDYESLKRVWMVCETKRENEFQKIFIQQKGETQGYINEIKLKNEKIEELTKENDDLKRKLTESTNQIEVYMKNYNEINKKQAEVENEKMYLISLLEEKNVEIEKLQNYEIEIAEMKAKCLLNEEYDKDSFLFSGYDSNDKAKGNGNEFNKKENFYKSKIYKYI